MTLSERGGTVEPTGVGIDVEPRRDPVSVHDAVPDLSVLPHVGVVGLDAEDKGPRGLVLQDGGVQAVVQALRGRGGTLMWIRPDTDHSLGPAPWTHVSEDRLVVVDVVDAHDDLSGAAEGVRSPGGVVVRGRDVEDVLRPPESGRGAPPQLDDACTQTEVL